jgi:hypothetical protein
VLRYAARAEFRRRHRGARWVLAGVIVEGAFHPAADGIEPVRARLPETGLVTWADLPTVIVAPDRASAATIALEVATARWPAEARGRVPFASGAPD